MPSPEVSVIIPIYNLENYLENTVESIRRQTFADMEIILVDDGSKDRTPEIIDELEKKDARISAIHKENGGVTSARLRGAAEATGEWIWFVDGDDFAESGMLELLLGNAKKYGADISHCGYQKDFPDGRKEYYYNTGCLAKQDRLTGLKELLDGSRIEPSLCNKLFHKSLLHSLLHDGVMDLSIKENEDLLMNFYLFREARLSIYEDVCPYHYMSGTGSSSRKKRDRSFGFDPLRVKEYILRDAPEELKEDAMRAYLGTCIMVYNSTIRCRSPESKRDRRKAHRLLEEHYAYARFLPRKRRLLAWMIRYAPWLYSPIYRVYLLHFQKKTLARRQAVCENR